MSEETLGTALVNEVCPVCAKKEEMIVMNTVLKKHEARKVKELHGKTVGIMSEPCKQCQDFMKQGIIVLAYDEEKSQNAESSNDLYRTGHLRNILTKSFL